MADNKVKFLRGTATEYEASTKDNDTFYYTTDDGKLYLGNQEITNDGVTIDDILSDTSKNPVQNKIITAALNNKAEFTDIPDKLPANGGNADTAERTVWENHVRDNTDILEFADNAPVLQRSFVRVDHSKNCPTDYGYSETNSDFWYVIDKLNALYATIIAVDVKSSAIFINTKSGGSWMGWKKIITDE